MVYEINTYNDEMIKNVLFTIIITARSTLT